MRFRYSFQKIVDLKANEKTQAEWMLSSAVGKLQVEESSLSTLRAERDAVRENAASAAEERIPVSELLLYQSYLDHIDQRIVSKNSDVRMAKQHVENRQSHLTDKMVEEKVWYRAREKAKLNFTASELKVEQDALDEMATVRRKRMS